MPVRRTGKRDLTGSLIHGVTAGRTVGLIRIGNNDSVDATSGVVHGERDASELLFGGCAGGNRENRAGACFYVAELRLLAINHEQGDRHVDLGPIGDLADVKVRPYGESRVRWRKPPIVQPLARRQPP